MCSVEVRIRVSRNSFSQVSTASQRSSSGVRFQRSHFRHTTQSRPLAASKARRRPTGKASTTSLAPRGLVQNMQEVYMGFGHAANMRCNTPSTLFVVPLGNAPSRRTIRTRSTVRS